MERTEKEEMGRDWGHDIAIDFTSRRHDTDNNQLLRLPLFPATWYHFSTFPDGDYARRLFEYIFTGLFSLSICTTEKEAVRQHG